ncbi:MAG: coagulation factor 5/8 type domain-containing protein [Bacteroidota bacterium]|nr:coagulation factor 5/8 type domain-containing protein [Bacteroidota bacterium]
MKSKLILINLLFLCFGIQNGSSQTYPNRNYTKPLPENVKAIAAKCNQTLLGKNTFVFDSSMDMTEVQTLIDSIYAGQVYPTNEFSRNRYALLFKPGTYKLDIRVGYYMHIMGLGNSPEDVVIIGAVRSNASQGHSLCNFWRTAENLTIVPAKDSTNTWAVSQAAPLRRVNVKGNLKLFEGASSGGFMADCKIDGTVFSGSQQQWLTRNSVFKKWDGGVWNMVYVGVSNAPKENWPEKPVTTIKETPEVREKPYWTYSGEKFTLKIPALKKNSIGVDWDKQISNEKTISIDDFYVAKADADNAKSINKALNKGKHILFTPGIYSLSESLKVKRPGTVVMGIGMATLVPEKGNKTIEVSDVDGVTIAGLLIDANLIPSEALMQIGKPGSKKNHSANPTYLFDVFFRIGGPQEGSASHCLVINSNNVCVDHAWFWRADHGNGIGWDKSKCANGLIVNGNNVTIYGLFNEHFQKYQTIWNGEMGRVYFYQCEMPYDVPSLEVWKHGEINGYASYKVGDQVKDHKAWGIGIYGFFDIPMIVDQAIETPTAVEDGFYHKVLVMLGWSKETSTVVKSVINGKGGELNTKIRKVMME